MNPRTNEGCVFCSIRDGHAPATVLCESERVLAFMDIRPIRPGQLVVIAKEHADEFVDLDDALAAEVFLEAQRLSRRVRSVLSPKRVGCIIHGFGVPHAHIVVVPLEHPWDITASQFAEVRDSRVVFRWEAVPLADRQTLEDLAARLRDSKQSARAASRTRVPS